MFFSFISSRELKYITIINKEQSFMMMYLIINLISMAYTNKSSIN